MESSKRSAHDEKALRELIVHCCEPRYEQQSSAEENAWTWWGSRYDRAWLQRLYNLSARVLCGHPEAEPSSSALCPRCGTCKPALWSCCPECNASPKEHDWALRVSLSERVRARRELEHMALQIRAGEGTNLDPELFASLKRVASCAVRVFRRTFTYLGQRPSPGLAITELDSSRRTAAILQASASTEAATQDPRFEELAREACASLLRAPFGVHPDRIRGRDGQRMANARGKLAAALSAELRFERYFALSVPQGVVGAFERWHDPDERIVGIGEPTRDRGYRGAPAAAIVALEADQPIERGHWLVQDLCNQLAEDLCFALKDDVLVPSSAANRALLNRVLDSDPGTTVDEALDTAGREAGVRLTLRGYVRLSCPPLPQEPGPGKEPKSAVLPAG